MESPIKPTVGRTVLFVLPEESKRAGEIRPATVVRVSGDRCNLSVATDGPNDIHRSADGTTRISEPDWHGSVEYHQPGEGEPLKPRTWHWMPYQLKTAAPATEPTPAGG